jgi:hypothetical protein
MNLHQEILQEHSKENVKKITDYIGLDEDRFAELMHIFLNGDYTTIQRSSWIVSECAEKYPFFIAPYFKNLIEKLHEPDIHPSARRNIVRIWQFVVIPEEYVGEVYDICFNYLSASTTEAIAVVVFSMTVCRNITKLIPELKPELCFMIEDVLMKHQFGSPAIKHRGKKILAELKKK